MKLDLDLLVLSLRVKLRLWAPPFTQSLQSQLVEEVVSTLFPLREEQPPPPMAPQPAVLDADHDDDDVQEEVIGIEL